MTSPLSLTLPWPPAMNTYYRTFRGRVLISEKGRRYRTQVIYLVRQAHPGLRPVTGRLCVFLYGHPPDQRKRDVDGFAKALLDALTHAGVWQDDEQIDHLAITRMPVIDGGQVVVRVAEVAA